MSKISVFGGGAWGMALRFAFSKKNDCYIVSRRKLNVDFQIDIHDAQDSDMFVVAISTGALEAWLLNKPFPDSSSVLVASKGIHNGLFVSDIFYKHYPKAKLSFLAGPSFAKEVMQGLPCALNIHSNNIDDSKEWIGLFPDFIKPYAVDDIIGGEICGAYKNVIAIASGIVEGLSLGANARASLLSRGLVEMRRFGHFFGAKSDTFLGLSGAGDLFLTANSTLSRNFRVGIGLAKGYKLEDILSSLGEVAEGVYSAKEIELLSRANGIYTPIASEVSLIINGKNPKDSMKDLMRN